jgi:membrane protein DedA with SNARE-associated domain
LNAIESLLAHPYAVSFALALANGLGLPIPQVPTLLLLGALAARGQVNHVVVFLLVSSAFLLSDLVWFELGRRRGDGILRLTCRISLEPDSCVRRAYEVFAGYGARAMLFQRFLPGVGLVASPILGVLGISRRRFVLLDALGTGAWVATYLSLGYVLAPQFERLNVVLRQIGGSLGLALVLGLAGYVAFKAWQRRRFLNTLRMSRITPDELRDKLGAGEQLLVVDLRHQLDFAADPRTIPGAVRVPIEEIERRGLSLVADREVILYCT